MAYIGKQPTPVPLSASDLNDDVISLAKMASGTDGNIITYDASGDPAVVGPRNYSNNRRCNWWCRRNKEH